ncbi:MAG TPA: hypothetical protein VKZ51_07995 [Cyclobacteriaceae bacterium]|nr:hypothetical protein [Cyclobacteriaceae bacterium]
MKSRISNFRKIISVFRKYGIEIIGERKFDHFTKDLHMDQVFVNGLIFEVEYELRKDLADEYLPKVSTPSALVSAFIQKEAVQDSV